MPPEMNPADDIAPTKEEYEAWERSHGDSQGLSQRITDYLSGGGLFNPELANHEAVRDLLIECRDELAMWKPMTPREAEKALAEAEAMPVSEEYIDEIIRRATDPATVIPNSEQARLAALVKRLELNLMAANNKLQAADTLCAAIDRTIHMRALDARSAIADARLNFSDRMYSPEEAQEIIEKRLYPHKASP